MRTIVSSGNDALNLLYEAANHEATNREDADASNAGLPQAADAYYGTPGSTLSVGTAPVATMPVRVSSASSDVLRVWNACRFVRMGWFRAEEAVTYVDLFFKNLSPLSPIITDFYSRHENHFQLVTQDPLLCCTILMISSRYHVLPGIGGASRSYFIHHRLWEHCQHLIMRIMLGQEKASKAKTRTVGSVEALLLMSEWHPRSLHFPPAVDGWDSDLILTAADDRDEVQSPSPFTTASKSWLEDVIEPARRSDRMSWMLLGCGLSLAHELGVFDDDNNAKASIGETQAHMERTALRRMRLRKLLYVFVEQLASRLGCTSMIPKSLNHSALQGISAANMSPLRGADQEWHFFMTAWIDLTKLVKSISDMLFPSASFSRQILRNGRYIGLLEHFQPLLSQWRKKHLDPKKLGDSLQDMLDIEYQYVRIYANSLGMQAVVERTLEEADSSEGSPDEALAMSLDAADYDFIQEVVDGSCAILQKVIKLAETGALLFSPVRIFLRITTSAIYLLKGLSLGVWTKKLQSSLDILDRSIVALRSSTLDDMHLASRYATLLDLHVARLRKSFVVSSRPPRLPTRPPSADRVVNEGSGGDTIGSGLADGTADFGGFSGGGDGGVDGMFGATDDWLALPFDASMAPFAPGDVPGFEDARLDFIWTLPL
ncbi:hypothetical protein H2201_002565 [Coniosporium apollinis]|uniref:Transcription factor domain-containing protein n=1 Tax=Coniosporium apollinis TaxID=61459 RepID=A0ABQ9NYA7_9PEZI|nr:hypothetical protein H2201_002565 [Coniosporium apollinis]